MRHFIEKISVSDRKTGENRLMIEATDKLALSVGFRTAYNEFTVCVYPAPDLLLEKGAKNVGADWIFDWRSYRLFADGREVTDIQSYCAQLRDKEFGLNKTAQQLWDDFDDAANELSTKAKRCLAKLLVRAGLDIKPRMH